MNHYITSEDFKDIYIKALQRGTRFVFSKFTISEQDRTRSSFNDIEIESANWWNIPMVRKRWNTMMTGDPNMNYETYVSNRIQNDKPHHMLSIGSGVCSHELEFARINPHWQITCMDFSEKLLEKAKQTAIEEGLINLQFLANDIYQYNLVDSYYDIVFFHASLHHFKAMSHFVQRIYNTLKPGGFLIINEFVGPNRLQYPSQQIDAINVALKHIDKENRRVYKTNMYKNSYTASGLLRMIISDPSECIESESILPEIHKRFRMIEEKPYGGNLLMPVLKHIAHHFIEPNQKQIDILQRLFELEDLYLLKHRSDFVLGIYQKGKE